MVPPEAWHSAGYTTPPPAKNSSWRAGAGGIWHSVPSEEGMRYESIWGYRRIFFDKGQWLPDARGLTFFGYLRTETHTNWRTALRLSKRSLASQVVVKMLLQPETCWNKCCHHGTYSVWISLLLTSSICLSVIAWFGIKRGSQVDTNIPPSINVHYSHCSKDLDKTKATHRNVYI